MTKALSQPERPNRALQTDGRSPAGERQTVRQTNNEGILERLERSDLHENVLSPNLCAISSRTLSLLGMGRFMRWELLVVRRVSSRLHLVTKL